MSKLTRFVQSIVREDNLPLHTQVYRLICATVAAVSLLLVLPMNALIGLPMAINLSVIAIGLLATYFLRASWAGREYRVLFYLALLAMLSSIWFINAGSQGSITYYYFAVLMYPVALFRGKQLWLMSGLLVLNISVLLVIEHFAPGLSVPFKGESDRIFDLLTGVIASCLAFSVVGWLILDTYDREQSRLSKLASELAVSERNYRALFNASNDAIFVHDEAGHVVGANDRISALFGLTTEDFHMRDVSEFSEGTSPYSNKEAVELIKRALAGEALVFEWHSRRADGSLFWSEIALRACEIAGQKRVIAAVRDIDARRAGQEALRKSEARLRLAMEAAHHGWFELDLSTGRAEVSEKYLQFIGQENTGYIPSLKGWMEGIHEDDKDYALDLFDRVLASGKTESAEYRRRTANGDWLWFSTVAKVVDYDANGKPLKICGTHTDITQRKKTEENLLSSEKRFSAIFRNCPVGISLSRLEDGVYIDVNDAYLEILGLPREQVIGNSSIGVKIWKSSQDRSAMFEDLSSNGRVHNIEHRYVTPSGVAKEMRFSAVVIEINGEKQIIGLTEDITEQKKAERESSERAVQYRQLFDEMISGLLVCEVILDSAGVPCNYRFLTGNPVLEKMTGYKVKELIGKTRHELPVGMPDEVVHKLFHVAMTGQPIEYERFNESVGKTYEVRVFAPRKGQFALAFNDVTQKRKTEATLKQTEERFRQAQKMEAVGQLAGGVAHDFNNILAALLLSLGTLRNNASLERSVQDNLKDLEHDVRRGANLTRQLLAFSRQQTMELKVINLHEVLSGLHKMLRRLLGEHIVLTLQASPSLPLVEIDVGMIEQAVVNLCVNSRDAMPNGGNLVLSLDAVEVSPEQASLSEEARAGSYLRLRVIDNGCGMDKDTIRRIFEPFYTTKAVGKGTGLGLASVYGIVKQLRGWIEVESEPGRGSTFSVFLPAVARAEPETPAADNQSIAPGRNELILVAEDEPILRTVVCDLLRQHGYQVLAAENGPAAIALWQKHRAQISLLFTDMVMPEGMSGKTLATRLREEKPELKVIIFTGYSREIVGPQLSSLNNMTVLFKPVDASRVLETVRKCLDSTLS